MSEIVVCCLEHGDKDALDCFPKVRGYYLVKYLRRIGLDVEYRTVPCEEMKCKVLISAEYQAPQEYLDRRYLPSLAGIRADRMFCLTDASLSFTRPDLRATARWFGQRGGVLVHMLPLSDPIIESHIGISVDTELLTHEPREQRNAVVFDFPSRAWRHFPREILESLRSALPSCRLIGSGPLNASISSLFDAWWPYGQTHFDFIRIYRGCAAFVPTCPESMGLAVAEAQACGACIVAPPGFIKRQVLCPTANVPYAGDTLGLCSAVARALERDATAIAKEAEVLFDPIKMARRVAMGVGLFR